MIIYGRLIVTDLKIILLNNHDCLKMTLSLASSTYLFDSLLPDCLDIEKYFPLLAIPWGELLIYLQIG